MLMVVLFVILSTKSKEVSSNKVTPRNALCKEIKLNEPRNFSVKQIIKMRIKYAERLSDYLDKSAVDQVRIPTPQIQHDTPIKPTNLRNVRLRSRTGFYLEVLDSGMVKGNLIGTNYSKF